jgi:hypothetical protein
MKKLEVLKVSEQRRFEAVVDADLRRRGYKSHPDLKLPTKIELVKQDAKEKEQWGVSTMSTCQNSSSWCQQTLTRQSLMTADAYLY